MALHGHRICPVGKLTSSCCWGTQPRPTLRVGEEDMSLLGSYGFLFLEREMKGRKETRMDAQTKKFFSDVVPFVGSSIAVKGCEL